ncbi:MULTISPECIES: squalene--hopene cyclase [Geobacter]|uniref:squalene--hopene cyclase n=1 Tax=Geobacter TaxID=28231 RepID=UPI0025739C55|nr:squalene--hopene cyclase [Geobacter sulfurreducens]BEH09218.1 squalene--hopene cyclase [Geobacter sulfurreducens subsp. ethanolicus]BET57101.1 squalene--hopene cyclase [Geobacter sp. 60473]HML80082.1 squalene--hopene cyclase [Geobacter sulfurreducens]
MKISKNPISHALTSFNDAARETADNSAARKSGKIHHLPATIWKKKESTVLSPLDSAIERTQEFFFREQLPAGYWWAELESNATITAEYIMLFHFMGLVNREKERKMANYLLRQQTTAGYWTIWHGGPGDLSTTIEAYFALKLAGYPADHPAMSKARAFILEHGGILKARVFTKIFLALFGEFSWLGVPSMPIEMMLLPTGFTFNMYEFSSWSRATIIPLSIVMAERPVRKLPPWARVQELYVRPPRPTDYTFTKEDGILTWKNIFIGIDHVLKVYEASPIRPGRKKAMAIAEKWVLEHQEPTGDWGGIQPAMLNSVLALHVLGYANDHPAVAKGLQALANFCIEGEDELVLQSCVSPVWDTALGLMAMVDSGVPTDHPSLSKAAQWLLDREVRRPGDWKIKCPDLEPGGWAFEFMNDWYPDVDDSGIVMMAIKDVKVKDQRAKEDTITRGIAWCLGMQSKNGGWGAFDKDNTKHILNKIPFADLEALIDPPTADLTGRMLELMGAYGYPKDHPAGVRALKFIRETQEPEGPWWGRWGVNYIYGTWSVMSGLAAFGEDMSQPWIRKAVEWLMSHQNEDGGWGECCESYIDPRLAGTGPSTASQTGWALLTLLAAGEVASSSVVRGVQYLLDTQKPDGTWDEDAFTGTGFPKFFMIKYHIYRNCFPLMALGRYRTLAGKGL